MSRTMNMNGMITGVKLNDGELIAANAIARERQLRNTNANVKEKKVDQNRSAFRIGYEGICGELVVAKLFNLCADLSVEPRGGSADLILQDRTRVDVKTNTRRPHDGDLICRNGKKIDDIDIFILVRGTIPVFDVVGWCYAQDLVNKNTLIDLRQPDGSLVPTHLLSWMVLSPIDRIDEHFKVDGFVETVIDMRR